MSSVEHEARTLKTHTHARTHTVPLTFTRLRQVIGAPKRLRHEAKWRAAGVENGLARSTEGWRGEGRKERGRRGGLEGREEREEGEEGRRGGKREGAGERGEGRINGSKVTPA